MSEKPTYEDLQRRIKELEQSESERRRVEKELRESEDRYRQLFNIAPAGIYEVDYRIGKLVYANDAVCKYTGYTKNELLSMNGTDLLTEKSQEKYLNRISKVLSGESVPISVDYEMIKKDGSVIWTNLNNKFLYEGENIVGATVVAIDITDRKKSDEALRQSEKRFRELAEMLPEAVFETDTDMNLSFASKHAFTLFGYSQQDFEDGINALDLLVPEDREKAADNVAKRFRGGSFGAIEYRALRKDGSSFPIFLHATPIVEQGITKGMRGIIVDLSERKLIEEQLQQSQKMEALGTLSGGIAHEFNNILGIIIGNTELAIDDVPEWNPAKDCLEEIRTASLRAKDVVRQIMSFSRKTPATRKPIQISTIIQESLKLMRATIPTNIEVNQEILCKDEMILANPTEINQIVMNLCSNAVHAMEGETGILQVRLERADLDHQNAARYEDLTPGKYVKLTVEDNGSGIDPKIMASIFDPYFTTKDVDKGLGMGLAVVYGIVKKQDGAIHIKSQLGVGTTAEVLFPITEDLPEKDSQAHDDQPVGTETILLVDDEPSLVKMASQILKKQGYSVIGKTNSAEALKAFEQEPDHFDLVISDMAMPEMPGDLLVVELLKIRPNVLIILCTGHSDRIDEKRAKALGVADYSMKPYEKKELVRKVRKVLDEAKG